MLGSICMGSGGWSTKLDEFGTRWLSGVMDESLFSFKTGKKDLKMFLLTANEVMFSRAGWSGE